MDVSQIEQYIEFPIDYEGQALVEKFMIGIISLGTVISALFGFALQDIVLCLYPFAAFVILGALVCLPAYSKFNEQKPVQFLKRPTPKPVQIEVD